MVKIIQRSRPESEINEYVSILHFTANILGITYTAIERKRTSFLFFKEVYIYIILEGDEEKINEFENLI
jgi:hypothetical protein